MLLTTRAAITKEVCNISAWCFPDMRVNKFQENSFIGDRKHPGRFVPYGLKYRYRNILRGCDKANEDSDA